MHRPLALLSIAVAFVAAACATPDPGLRVATPPHATPAADVAWGELTFTGAGGVQLYGQHWRPVTGAPRGVLVMNYLAGPVLAAIPGQVPALAEMPAGCRFADRCELAQPQCRTHRPPLVKVGAGPVPHRVACPVVIAAEGIVAHD